MDKMINKMVKFYQQNMAKVVLLKLVKYGNTENIDMVEYGRNGSKIDKIWVLKNMTKSTPKGASII